MSFKIFKRKDFVKRDDLPQISIRPNTIAFNAELTNKAKLSQYQKVKILVDEENYRLGFIFHSDENDPHSLRLYSDSITKSSRAVSARQLLKTYKWIESVSKLTSPLDKRFMAKWNNIEKAWIINLCPSFENVISNESQLKDLVGIYRYKRGDEIVYIGRGIIKSRINSPDRSDWEFDTIEYSIIKDPETQAKWESYWLDRYAQEHGQLPLYNKIKTRRNLEA